MHKGKHKGGERVWGSQILIVNLTLLDHSNHGEEGPEWDSRRRHRPKHKKPRMQYQEFHPFRISFLKSF